MILREAEITDFEKMFRRVIQEELRAGGRIPDRKLTVRGAAELTGYSHHTLYKKAQNGDIPSHRIGSGKLFFVESELEEWMNAK